jgi:hypothetical protein
VLKNDQFGAALAGSTFMITQTVGGAYTATVADGGAGDMDALPGRILFQNVPLGTYTVTETIAPPGYVGGAPQTGIVVNSSAVVTVTFTNLLGQLEILKVDGLGAAVSSPLSLLESQDGCWQSDSSG